MRIDLSSGPLAPEASPNRGQSTVRNADVHRELELDQAQFSTSHAQIHGLATKALQVPEVRQDRVQALRLAIQNGEYHPQPSMVAGAIMVHMIRETTA